MREPALPPFHTTRRLPAALAIVPGDQRAIPPQAAAALLSAVRDHLAALDGIRDMGPVAGVIVQATNPTRARLERALRMIHS